MQQEFPASQFDDFHHFVMKTHLISIPANRCDWGNLLKFQKNSRQSNISSMQNVFYPIKKPRNRWIKKIMCIRNDSNLHTRVCGIQPKPATNYSPKLLKSRADSRKTSSMSNAPQVLATGPLVFGVSLWAATTFDSTEQ